MLTFCRICTKACAPAHAISIFSFHRKRLILDLILIFCPIRIDRADNLPQKICESCFQLIWNANELREKSVRSDYKLRQASFKEVETCEAPKKVFQPETGSEQVEDTEMVAIKEENPLETSFVIKEVASIVDQEETTNFSFLDEFQENDNDEQEVGEDTGGSDHASVEQPSNNSNQAKNLHKPMKSKYKKIGDRYKCPYCPKTYSLSTSIPFHIKTVHPGYSEYMANKIRSKMTKNKYQRGSRNAKPSTSTRTFNLAMNDR